METTIQNLPVKCNCGNIASFIMKIGLNNPKSICHDCKNYWDSISDNKPEKPQYTQYVNQKGLAF